MIRFHMQECSNGWLVQMDNSNTGYHQDAIALTLEHAIEECRRLYKEYEQKTRPATEAN